MNGFVEQEESSIMPKESSKWTNEKHSLYLKSIEASFVDQLYNSLDMQTRQTRNTCSSDAISSWKNQPNPCIPSAEIKALLQGCWSKKCYKTEKSHPNDADRPHVPLRNPWIQRFTNGSRKRLSLTPTPSSLQLRQGMGCSDTEATDQNFVQNTSCSRKRTRSSKIADSSNDQVVPNYTSDATKSPILM